MKKFSLVMIVALAIGAFAGCATQKAAAPAAPANPDKEAAERYANPPPSEASPGASTAPPQEGDGAKGPEIGKDFGIGLAVPSPEWEAMPASRCPEGVDLALINRKTKSLVLFSRVPFNYYDGNLNEAAVDVMQRWAKDPTARNELPQKGVTDGLNWARATGTFEAKPGHVIRRRLLMRQLSEQYDTTVILVGMWPEALDAQVGPEFESIVNSLQIVLEPPPDAAPPAQP